MQMSFQYGTKTIIFDVAYSPRRKTMEISVEPPDLVHVVAPEGASERAILDKVRSRASWIVQRLFAMRDMAYIPIKREMVNGESFMYLGRNYSLQVTVEPGIERSRVGLINGKFQVVVATGNEAEIHNALEQWYKQKALEKIIERVNYYQSKVNVKPAQVRVKDQKKRWASCTSKGELLFNWKSIMAPSPVLDYIVVHEMAHLLEHGHSQKFWDIVAAVLPDYSVRKEWLKNNGIKMDL
ncbi:metal-dependent hydrolase [Clostridium thermosuccinogenes]|uniref:Metal-dependent hydrolase n=1 Tax=Clostridium thermosuccinogenes TaxID=84032 RepID=A0A2K2FDU1_9CLOT|nr:SprT family zinc-dependent metalloprotease [Pseudoclostridium thermosuccinogenes]AUS98048.1 metal-dependent hydrolase [Pseudoclostridium thermosuccinogenes]PNT95703.1 metal-dependent hydrolase [Pseudoclostridium thermosuccinogenes]PNT96960.1 metal-dependent hydrolase [Pseudoclostridium thermosuccinogenes]